ncbi:MAG TPA: hypothetical protein VKN99_08400 [Polyangia bacterium]|nr:hypothetical protein [Polyangia bacterium]
MRLGRRLLLLLPPLLLLGCADRIHLYRKTGRAKQAAFARQAGQKTHPAPAGLDGRDASLVMDNYRRAQLAPGAAAAGPPAPGAGGGRAEESP